MKNLGALNSLRFFPKPNNTQFKDFEGLRFGRLAVIGHLGRDKNNNRRWLCVCDCGEKRSVQSSNLTSGTSQSCGCIRTEIIRKHGASKTPEYINWAQMMARCSNLKHEHFNRYGGRGITVCERWLDFNNFLADMGERPEGRESIERINNDLGYSPDNCRWASMLEQANNRCSSRFITWNGKTQTVAQWSRETGINRNTVVRRAQKGLALENIHND